MSIYFVEKDWQELKKAVERDTLILLPVGQVEEHGYHLPVKTDVFIAERIARSVADQIKEEISVLVTPSIWSGYSTKEIMQWPGCINVGIETFINLVYDICSSLIRMGFVKIVILSTHGNHTGALRVVVRKIADDFGVYIALTVPSVIAKEKISSLLDRGWQGSIHGGEYETSLMFYLEENSVRKDRITDRDVMKIDWEFYPGKVFISTWGLQKSKTGIYGDPTAASKEKGEKIFKAIVETYKSFLKEFYWRMKNEKI